MSAIVNRMKYLRNAEAMFAIAFPVMFLLSWRKPGAHIAWELRVPAMLLLSYILLQGATYWHLKISSLEQRVALPLYFGTLFRTLKWSNHIFIVAMLVSLVAAWANAAQLADLQWAGSLLAFAFLEQVNYFHYQLMYDTRGAIASLRRNARLRRAALAVDLARV